MVDSHRSIGALRNYPMPYLIYAGRSPSLGRLDDRKVCGPLKPLFLHGLIPNTVNRRGFLHLLLTSIPAEQYEKDLAHSHNTDPYGFSHEI